MRSCTMHEHFRGCLLVSEKDDQNTATKTFGGGDIPESCPTSCTWAFQNGDSNFQMKERQADYRLWFSIPIDDNVMKIKSSM